VLCFEKVTVTHLHDVDASTVIREYEPLLHRADLGGSFRRRYIAVMTPRHPRIASLREYGGPLIPSEGEDTP
jgi:ketosteroid isomerase-like protein